MDRELKPCPFCGCKAIKIYLEDYYFWRCQCTNCYASAIGNSADSATEAWNWRA